MKRRIEPEPALGGEIRAHVNVEDQESVVKHLAFALQSEHGSDRAPRAVGDDEPVAVERVLAILCRNPHDYAIRLCRNANDLVPPAQLRVGQLADPLDEKLLDIVLLQVDERGAAMPLLGQQVELVYLLVAKEHAADVPAHALLDEPLAATQPVENLQRPLRPADRAGADAHRGKRLEPIRYWSTACAV